jgi:hypothetical protein
MQGNVNLDRIAMLILGLTETNATVANMLRTQPWCVLASPLSVTQNIQREPRLCARWVPFVVLFDLIGRPTMVPCRSVFKLLNSDCWVDCRFFSLIRPREQRA